MDPFTKLPTDSLYKFMALGGLLMTLSAAGGLFHYERQLRVQQVELSVGIESLLTKSEWASDRLNSLRQSDPQAAQQYWEENSTELIESGLELRLLNDRLVSDLETFGQQKVWLSAAALAGLLLAAAGLVLWFVRVQRFQDRLMTARVAGDDAAPLAENEGSSS